MNHLPEFRHKKLCIAALLLCLLAALHVVPPAAVASDDTVSESGHVTAAAAAPEQQPSAEPPPAHVKSDAEAGAVDSMGLSVPQFILDQANLLENGVDTTHDRLEYSLLQHVIRLDDFLGSVSVGDQQKTHYQIRLRSTSRFDEGGKVTLGSTLRVNLVLSKISKKLHLIVSGEKEQGTVTPSLPEDPGTPGLDRIFQSTRLVNTELRYSVMKSSTTDLFLGAGVNLGLPLDAFTRSRFQFSHAISTLTLLRIAETLFINSTIGLGETSEISVERSLGDSTLLRWSNMGIMSQKISGLEFGTELSLIRQLSTKNSISFTGGIYGNSTLDDIISNFRLTSRYRQNFLRSWLFFELEPELSWPRQTDGVFSKQLAIMFRIEVLFHGSDTDSPPGSRAVGEGRSQTSPR